MKTQLLVGVLLMLLFAGCSRPAPPKPLPPPPPPPVEPVVSPERLARLRTIRIIVLCSMATIATGLLLWSSRHPPVQSPGTRVIPPPVWTDHAGTRNHRVLDLTLPVRRSPRPRHRRKRRIP